MSEKKQKMRELTSYDTAEEFMEATNLRKDFEEYHAPECYRILGKLQVKCEFIK